MPTRAAPAQPGLATTFAGLFQAEFGLALRESGQQVPDPQATAARLSWLGSLSRSCVGADVHPVDRQATVGVLALALWRLREDLGPDAAGWSQPAADAWLVAVTAAGLWSRGTRLGDPVATVHFTLVDAEPWRSLVVDHGLDEQMAVRCFAAGVTPAEAPGALAQGGLDERVLEQMAALRIPSQPQ